MLPQLPANHGRGIRCLSLSGIAGFKTLRVCGWTAGIWTCATGLSRFKGRPTSSPAQILPDTSFFSFIPCLLINSSPTLSKLPPVLPVASTTTTETECRDAANSEDVAGRAGSRKRWNCEHEKNNRSELQRSQTFSKSRRPVRNLAVTAQEKDKERTGSQLHLSDAAILGAKRLHTRNANAQTARGGSSIDNCHSLRDNPLRNTSSKMFRWSSVALRLVMGNAGDCVRQNSAHHCSSPFLARMTIHTLCLPCFLAAPILPVLAVLFTIDNSPGCFVFHESPLYFYPLPILVFALHFALVPSRSINLDS